jgi:hypothetical protein
MNEREMPSLAQSINVLSSEALASSESDISSMVVIHLSLSSFTRGRISRQEKLDRGEVCSDRSGNDGVSADTEDLGGRRQFDFVSDLASALPFAFVFSLHSSRV